MRLSDGAGSRRALFAAVLLALALTAAFALSAGGSATGSSHDSAAAASMKDVKASLPLPENGRQKFAVLKLRVKQDERPKKIKRIDVTNAGEVPADVRAGAETAGPVKKKRGRWEYVILVAINDLGEVARTRAGMSQGDSLDLIIRSFAEHFEEGSGFPIVDDCPSKLDRELGKLEGKLQEENLNEQLGYTTHDGQVIVFARQDSEPFCE